MRFDFIKPLAVTILLCVLAELAAFGGLVLSDIIHGLGVGEALHGRLAMHPLAPKTVITYGSFDPIMGFAWPAKLKIGNVITNEHGFVANTPDGASPPGYPDKPSDVFRIVLLGNSTLAGNALRSDVTYTISAKLETILNDTAPGARKYQVLNFGLSGAYSFSELRLFLAEVIHLKPDAVISLDGYTDAVEAAFATERSGLGHGMIDWTQPIFQEFDAMNGLDANRAPPPLVFTYIYLALQQVGLIHLAQAPARLDRYETMPWYRDSANILAHYDGWNLQLVQNVEAIAAYCKEKGIFYINYLQPFAAYARAQNEEERIAMAAFHAALVRNGDKYWELDSYTRKMAAYYSKYRELYRGLAEEYEATPNVRFIDISELFAQEPRRIYLDAAHYNELGNQTIAARFAADLLPLIAEGTKSAQVPPD